MNADIIENPPGPETRQTGFWVDAGGNYYEGDRRPESAAVPRKPSAGHVLRGGAWVVDGKLAARAAIQLAEEQQASALTPRALREALLTAFEAGGKTTSPVYTFLKDLDAEIATEREKL